MTIADKLAQTFVKAARAKSAAPKYFSLEDIPGAAGTDAESLRAEFEESQGKEEVLRRKAQEYARLGRQRSEDQSPAAKEFFKRLTPIPYTGGEFAWRAPAIAAGGIAGYHGLPYLMRGSESRPANVEELARTLRMVPGSRNAPPTNALVQQLEAMTGAPVSPEAMKALQSAPLEDLAKFVGHGRADRSMSEPVQAVAQALGKNSPEELREAYIRAASGARSGKEPMQFFQAGRKWPKWVGGAGGLAGASILTGLPLAIRSSALRRTGGEFAHQARKRMEKAVEKSEREQFRRENILRILKGEPALPMTEWRGRKGQLREDWRSSMKEYRERGKARRAGRKTHGVTVPETKEATLNDFRQLVMPIPNETLSAAAYKPSELASGVAMHLPKRIQPSAAKLTSGLAAAEQAAGKPIVAAGEAVAKATHPLSAFVKRLLMSIRR